MHESATPLEGLPGPAEDIDVGDHGEWVAICRQEQTLVVASAVGRFAVPGDIRFPLIRWVGGGDILVIDTRTSRGRLNAHIFSPSGLRKASFCVGDGVQNAVAVGEKFVVTYFDEGIFGDVPPSQEGLCVFSPDGALEFGYQSGVRNPVDVADCYCVCAAGAHEICFSPYTGFPLVRLNLKTREQHVSQLPGNLAGAAALSTDGIDFYFHSPYRAKHSLMKWRPGSTAHEIGSYRSPLRACNRGAFLSTGPAGYTLVHE